MEEKSTAKKMLTISAALEIVIAVILGIISFINVKNSSDAAKIFATGGATAGGYALILIGGIIVRACLGIFGLLSDLKPLLVFFGIILVVMSIPASNAGTLLIAIRVIALIISIIYTISSVLLKSNTIPTNQIPLNPMEKKHYSGIKNRGNNRWRSN